MSSIEDVVLKIMTDTHYAQRLLDNPETVLRAEGIEPTPEILEVLQGLDTVELAKIAAKFTNEGIAM